jgi:O-antigen/teichoic acid export membrane protein
VRIGVRRWRTAPVEPMLEGPLADAAVAVAVASTPYSLADKPLGSAMRRGVVWTAASRLAAQALQLGTTVALARLLAPEAFGVVAVVTAITGFANVFVELGLSSAIVQREEVDEQLLATAFWLNVALGLLMASILSASASLYAGFFEMPELTWLIPLASVSFILSLGVVQTGLLRRRLDFRRLSLNAIANTIATSTVAITGAALGLGPAALVLGALAGTVASTLQLWLFVPWRPRRGPDRTSAARLWSYSRGLLGFGVVNYWSRNADNLIVGKYLGATALGYYGRAYNLMMLPVAQASAVLTTVLFPALSRVQRDPSRFGRAWLLSTKASWVIGTPLALGVVASAPALVQTLFGDRWLPMVPVLALLSASGPLQLIGSNTGPVFQALGKTGLHFKLGLATSALTIAAILIGLPFGITGIAAALLVKSFVSIWITLIPTLRMTGVSVSHFLRSLALTGVGAGVMAGAMVLAACALFDSAPAPARLALQIAVGAVVYGIFVALGERRFISALRGGAPPA